MTDPRPALEAVSWFGKPPDAAKTFISAPSMALWRLDQDELIEFRAQANDDVHMLCAHVSGFIDWAAELDSRRYERPCLPGTFCLQIAGEGGKVRYRDARASFVHFYLPRHWLADRAVEFETGVAVGSLELVDPMNARCEEVGRWATVAARGLREGLPGGRLEAEAVALLVASVLLRKHSNLAIRTRSTGGLAGWQLARTKEALSEAGAAPDLATLAANVGLSQYHFCRAFRQSTGMPPHRYQMMSRVERAKDLLANTRLPVIEIAAAVGYQDQGQLTRLLRKEIGLTPSQYRRERQR